MRRPVVTGMGIVSCLGCDLPTVTHSLQNSESGIIVDPERVRLGFASPLTGQLKGYDGASRLSRKVKKSMSEPALYAALAAYDAIADAGLSEERLRSYDVGVLVGNDSTVKPSAEVVKTTLEQGYTGALGSGAIFQVMNSTVTMNLCTLLGTKGANWTLSAACASGAHAIGQAAMLVASGQQEIVVCGGAQELNWESMAAFDALRAFSASTDPGATPRPFSRDRDGLVPSGGAAILIVESDEHAKARGARIYGEIAGYAFSANGGHLTHPSVDAPAWAMNRALDNAHLRPEQIDYVNAHATGTPAGDLQEGRSLLDVFGADGPPVSSTKSITGHECWMSGASEIIYSLLMIEHGFLAANANLTELEPELAGLQIILATRDTRPRTILSNSFGFGGTNAALVLRAV